MQPIYRPSTNGTTSSNGSAANNRTSLSSFPSSRSPSQLSRNSRPSRSPQNPMMDADRTSDPVSNGVSKAPSGGASPQHSSLSIPRRHNPGAYPKRKLKSQYPRGSTDNHVEYILVASFDIDRGPIMEHQYPVAITGDENMLAELMLPDQAHVRNQDWTIFFLHKDTSEEDEAAELKEEKQKRRRRGKDTNGGLTDRGADGNVVENEEDISEVGDESSNDSEPEGGEGPPLIYVLNLVNTKQDKTVKRGAIVKAMAICTRHPFLHIYKPLLLLALDGYFKAPHPATLASLYGAVNTMDLSLMPRLTILERTLLQCSDNKDLFVEKFEHMIQMRIAGDRGEEPGEQIDGSERKKDLTRNGTRAHVHAQSEYSVPRDTHEFETKVNYNGIPIPIKVPVAISPETVGDFSLIKLIQTYSEPHAKSPQPFTLHPHLTTGGAFTHPIIVLANAMLTQKRVIFLGHNRPSGEVAEAVLAACALTSGGILRGFSRHAFPYTDLTKIDDLLKVPGFIAGVTNPTFENHPEWWDLLCDLPTGRMKISSRIEPAPLTEGLIYFQQQNPHLSNVSNVANSSSPSTSDPTGDAAFMTDVLRSIAARHGEGVIRAKWRDWVDKFTRVAAAFEESVYGASALYFGGEETDAGTPGVSGHGYVWSDEAAKQRELAGGVSRIEGWRNTRSYYSFIQDLAQLYNSRPLISIDLQHIHDRLRSQKLTSEASRDIYIALEKHINTYDEICQLLTVAPESHAGLFYIALGLFHKDRDVRIRIVDLLERISQHEAGQHWWNALSRFEKFAYIRIKREREAEIKAKGL